MSHIDRQKNIQVVLLNVIIIYKLDHIIVKNQDDSEIYYRQAVDIHVMTRYNTGHRHVLLGERKKM